MTESPTRPALDVVADDQRAMMRGFPTGVAVVTSIDHSGQPRGMTCSSVCSVSLNPPTLLVCLRVGSPTLAAVTGSGCFAVNLLHGGGQPTAELFASGTPDRFDLVHWERVPRSAGPHLPADASAIADCDVDRIEAVGDHAVVFGRTRQVILRGERPPLVYGQRRYRIWQP